MKKMIILAITILISITFLSSCGGKGDVVEIKNLAVYEDPAVKFSVKYPDNWINQQVPGARFLVFSSTGAKSRFIQYDPLGTAGAKIEILVSSLDSNVTLDTVIANKLFQADVYSDPEIITIDGVQGVKQTYDFELEDGPFHGEVYYATKDNKLATTLYFEAFGGTFDEYKKSFDEILASLKLAAKPEAKTDTLFEEVEADPPSETLRTVSGEGFSIGIPDNFNKERGMYMGKRRGDSYIKVDAFDAEKTTDLGKLVDENRKSLPGASSTQNLTINGEKSMKVAYKPSGKVAGEMYFILKNKKLYRITLNWFKGEEKDFKPIFQKCAMTFKVQ
ncbi:hypothetical protein ACFLSQ_10040 [Bacteroidota bacterium]